MIGRILRRLFGHKRAPTRYPGTANSVPVMVLPTPEPEPFVPVPPLLTAEGFRILWKVGDAVVVWLAHSDRINGRWTCAEIAEGINADDAFRFEHRTRLDAPSVNAAMSGISIRAQGTKFVTDIDMGDSQSVHAKPEDGLRTPWAKRQWQLTPNGIGRARTLVAGKNRYTVGVEHIRAAKAVIRD